MKRPVYRKWFNPDDNSQHYLTIHPSGIMLEISFEKDGHYGQKVVIYQTSPLNPMNPDVFKKYKEVCGKPELEQVQRKVIQLTKGALINLAFHKSKQTQR